MSAQSKFAIFSIGAGICAGIVAFASDFTAVISFFIDKTGMFGAAEKKETTTLYTGIPMTHYTYRAFKDSNAKSLVIYLYYDYTIEFKSNYNYDISIISVLPRIGSEWMGELDNKYTPYKPIKTGESFFMKFSHTHEISKALYPYIKDLIRTDGSADSDGIAQRLKSANYDIFGDYNIGDVSSSVVACREDRQNFYKKLREKFDYRFVSFDIVMTDSKLNMRCLAGRVPMKVDRPAPN